MGGDSNIWIAALFLITNGEFRMRHLLALTIAAGLAVGTATAQTATEPQLDVTVIEQDSGSSAQGIFVPIFAVLLLLLLHIGGESPAAVVITPA